MINHKKQLDKLHKAWLVKWVPFGDHAIPLAKKMSPQGEILDILSSRKNFDYIREYAKNIYKLSALSLSEKFSFAHYMKGEKCKKDFFSRVLISTYEQSNWYRTLQKEEMENPDNEALREKWRYGYKNNSRYIIIGHNPYLEIREVFNLTRAENKNGKTIFAWDTIIDGTLKPSTYIILPSRDIGSAPPQG